jgi:hypothetical protein
MGRGVASKASLRKQIYSGCRELDSKGSALQIWAKGKVRVRAGSWKRQDLNLEENLLRKEPGARADSDLLMLGTLRKQERHLYPCEGPNGTPPNLIC